VRSAVRKKSRWNAGRRRSRAVHHHRPTGCGWLRARAAGLRDGAGWFFPFVGAGGGYARATFSEGLTGKTQGPAYQGLAGLEFRFKQIGFYVQYKYRASTTGDPGKQVKVGGSGIVAGVSLVF